MESGLVARKPYRLYCVETQKWVGKATQTCMMTEKEVKLRNDNLPSWSAMRWKEVENVDDSRS